MLLYRSSRGAPRERSHRSWLLSIDPCVAVNPGAKTTLSLVKSLRAWLVGAQCGAGET